MRYSIPLRVLCIALFPFLFATACDSGGSNDSVDNQFSLTIEPTSSSGTTVEQQEEVSGFSFFVDAEDTETEEEAFAIYMDNEESFSTESASQGLFG